MDMCTLLYFQRVSNKDLLSSTGTSARCHAAAWMGGEPGREGVRVAEALAVPLQLPQRLNRLDPDTKYKLKI